MLILSDVPIAEPEQVEYFYNLEQAMISILSISMEWNISISVGDISIERRLGLGSNVVVSVVFTSLSADPGYILILQSKLDNPAFFDQLNSLGFKASSASPQLTSTSNQAPSSLVVGLCSAAGGLTCLALLFCLAHRLFGCARDKSQKDAKSGTFVDDSFAKCSLEIPGDILDKGKADEATADSNCIVTGILPGIDQISEADYSKEFEDVLQLIVRLAISIKTLVDPLLRKEFEAAVQHSDEITAHDCAAALQLIGKIELDDKSLVHTPGRKNLLQQRIGEGPLTENHLLVLKLLCEAEVASMAVNEDKKPVACEVLSQQTLQFASHSQSEITEDKVSESCDKSLIDVLTLLKSCDLKPSYLMQNESRKLIEDNLTLRQGPLLAEHLAVLQLISKAEIDSGLSIDSMRQNLLKKRIEEGPLNADHLKAALFLHQVEKGELHDVTQIASIGHAETGSAVGASQVYAAVRGHHAKPYESCDVSNSVGHQVFSAGHDALAQEIKSTFFMDTISGLEVRSSLLSREEKSALQLMELRAKTARIRQSLPEWVRNGLVPPRHNPSPPAVPAGTTLLAAVLAENVANCSHNQAGRDAVQISCNVQADLGFLNDFMPAAAPPKLHEEALESVFLRVEQYADITRDEQQPASASGWQVEPLAGEVLRLSPTPPSGTGSSLAWLFSALALCVSNCLRAVMGACCSGLGCLTSRVSGNRD